MLWAWSSLVSILQKIKQFSFIFIFSQTLVAVRQPCALPEVVWEYRLYLPGTLWTGSSDGSVHQNPREGKIMKNNLILSYVIPGYA
jgi:hypothetical protein